jgi:formylmethanofuran dehydrogenase subunit E
MRKQSTKLEGVPDVAVQRVVSQHAMVVKDGYTVPLIGIPPSAVMETCDCCHEEYGMSELTWSGQQMLCKKCAG